MPGLSTNLIKEFVRMTDDSKTEEKQTRFFGTASVESDGIYVKLDGSEFQTPVSMATDAQTGDRVIVEIVNHSARIIQIVDKSSSDVVADHINKDTVGVFSELRVGKEYVDTLIADDITAESIKADKAKIEELEVTKGYVDELITDNAAINKTLKAHAASIGTLETDKLNAKEAELKYANIDFSNIGEATMEYFYSKSGLIKNVTVGDQTITGELVGVTIKGDLIEGETVKADKLVIRGEDGLFYKLNVDALGEATVSSDEKYQNGLDGTVIIAKTITAEQISVKDLVAFGATIGGFIITDDSIYSGVKSSVGNTTRGIYLDDDGQFSFGDSNNFIRFYKSTSGDYKLQIRTNSLRIGSSGTDIADEIDDIKNEIETVKDEVTTNLRIESSRGTVFKNNAVSTVLSAVIYRGSQRITDITALKEAMGSSAYLQWSWQRLDETSFGIISATDSRIGNDGFTFTLSPDDVDTKVTFLCQLIV